MLASMLAAKNSPVIEEFIFGFADHSADEFLSYLDQSVLDKLSLLVCRNLKTLEITGLDMLSSQQPRIAL